MKTKRNIAHTLLEGRVTGKERRSWGVAAWCAVLFLSFHPATAQNAAARSQEQSPANEKLGALMAGIETHRASLMDLEQRRESSEGLVLGFNSEVQL